MRLLDVRNVKLHTFYGDDIPPYAILSHTWFQNNEEEVTFAQLQEIEACRMIPGFLKIEYLCQQAVYDGFDWAWIDTCCIDKTNSSELSEAINSMFDWYRRSKVCYAYLTDVDAASQDDIASSRWWTRAWTLQELLAPGEVIFYDLHWIRIGTKATLTDVISNKTGIDREVLHDPGSMYTQSVAQRMSWAAHREATRIEDVAYSLLGIFAVTMSMKYGEGKEAFKRLQKKIVKFSNDQSLFAWSFKPQTVDKTPDEIYIPQHSGSWATGLAWNFDGIFAGSPKMFTGCKDIIFHSQHALDNTFGEFNGALSITMPLFSPQYQLPPLSNYDSRTFRIGILPCGYVKAPNLMVGLLLEEWTPGRYRRASQGDGVFTFLVDCQIRSQMEIEKVWIDHLTWIVRHNHAPTGANHFHRSLRVELNLPTHLYSINVLHAQDWVYDEEQQTLQFHHAMDSRNRRLAFRLNRYDEDSLIITLSLENAADNNSLQPYSQQGNNISIRKWKYLDKGGSDDNLLLNRLQRLEDSFEDVRATLNTRKMFNHLASVLTVSPSAEYDAMHDLKDFPEKRGPLPNLQCASGFPHFSV